MSRRGPRGDGGAGMGGWVGAVGSPKMGDSENDELRGQRLTQTVEVVC